MHEAPTNASSKEELDHIGSIVYSLTLHCKRLFRNSNPWPQGHMVATLPLANEFNLFKLSNYFRRLHV